MDWGDLERLIDAERSRRNPVAEIILKCMFKQGKLVLGLREEDEREEDEEVEEVQGELVEIEVDLGLSAWANAREYFDRKKLAAEKVYDHADLIEHVLMAGIANYAVIVQGAKKCRTKDHRRSETEFERGKTSLENITGNKVVRKVLLVY